MWSQDSNPSRPSPERRNGSFIIHTPIHSTDTWSLCPLWAQYCAMDGDTDINERGSLALGSRWSPEGNRPKEASLPRDNRNVQGQLPDLGSPQLGPLTQHGDAGPGASFHDEECLRWRGRQCQGGDQVTLLPCSSWDKLISTTWNLPWHVFNCPN